MAKAPTVRMIPLSRIVRDADQPRQHFDTERLEGLKNSIESEGLKQPIHVRPHPTRRGCFVVVAGERRLRCCTELGYTKMPCIVLESDVDALVFSIVENVQREDLSPIEEARGYERLIQERRMTGQDIAKHVGKSGGHISVRLALLELPESLQRQVMLGHLGVNVGYLLVKQCSSQKEMEDLVTDVRKRGGPKARGSYDRVSVRAIRLRLDRRDRITTQRTKGVIPNVLEENERMLVGEIIPAAKRLLGLMEQLVNGGVDTQGSMELCRIMMGLMRANQQRDLLESLRAINVRTGILLNHLRGVVSRQRHALQKGGSRG